MKAHGYGIFIAIYVVGGLSVWMLPAKYVWITPLFALVWFVVAGWATKWILFLVDKAARPSGSSSG